MTEKERIDPTQPLDRAQSGAGDRSGVGDQSETGGRSVSENQSGAEDDSAGFWDASPPAMKIPMPKHIGRYRILGLICSGGMGVVYRAEQDNPKRVVALKVMRSGLTSDSLLGRFRDESQLLGRLHHKGIAQVFEAGTADTGSGDQPFFAMEYIEGGALSRYAVERQLDIRNRLALVADICDAVHHAHQKGIIHRDLKPGNILVDDTGQPKVLDFGVARVTNSDVHYTTMRTNVGQVVGTLPYMSPEQMAGRSDDLDIRTDVYAIGVILYELLGGRLPFDFSEKTLPEIARIVTEIDPAPLSSVNRSCRGDIETIVTKALEKDRRRRYASASELASDLRRHLVHEPISARPASGMYQLRKFAARNRALVGGVLTVMAVLILGIAGTTIGMVRARNASAEARAQQRVAEDQRNIAESEARRADDTYRFFEQIFTTADPAVSHGEEITVRQVVDRAADRVESETFETPKMEGVLRTTIGNTYRTLGVYDQAEHHLRRALEIRREIKDPQLYVGLNNLAIVLGDAYKYDEAEVLFREAVDYLRSHYSDDHAEIATNLLGIADALGAKGDYDGAESVLKDVIARRRSAGGSPDQLAAPLNNLAIIKCAKGAYAECAELHTEALDYMRVIHGDEHPKTCTIMNNLAQAYNNLAEYDKSVSLMQDVLRIRRKIYEPNHPKIAAAANNLAATLRRLGHLEEAEALYRESVAIYREVFGSDHVRVAVALNNLAGPLRDRGEYDTCVALYTEAIAILNKRFGDEHIYVASALGNLASIYNLQGDLDTAEQILRNVLAIQERLLGADHPRVALAHNNLAANLQDQHQFDAAERQYLLAIEIRRAALGEDHPDYALSLHWLGDLEKDRGNYEAADARYQQAIDVLRRNNVDHGRRLAKVLLGRVNMLIQIERFDAAESLAVEALAIRVELHDSDIADLIQARGILAMVHVGLGKYEASEQPLLDYFTALEHDKRAAHLNDRKRAAQFLVKLYTAVHREDESQHYAAFTGQ